MTSPPAGPAASPGPRLVRPGRGRVVAGVAAGLAEHLRVEVAAVRWAFVLLNVVGGAGVFAYGLLALLTPAGDGDGERPERPTASRLILAGLLLAVVGCGLLLVRDGRFDPRADTLIPVVVAAVGAVLAWSQLDGADRRPWAAAGPGRRLGVSLGLGVALVVAGILVVATRGQNAAMAWEVVVATLAVLAGVALVLTPWGLRFWRRYQVEAASRARETERADIAAHLHDSVLQTLALIQRTDDPQRVTQLARAQERELRTWLYGGLPAGEATLAAAVARVVHEVEDRHGVPIDLVVIGDRDLDDRGQALVRAAREALLNAVRHGAAPVAAYVEIGPSETEAFIRDHGAGFDVDEVPHDRLGVRESILGRMDRAGGSARVRRLDEGTEVHLRLPVGPAATPTPEHSEETT